MVKLLIIEDDLLLNEAYKKKFSGKYDVRIVTDGTDGIRTTKSWKPDVILLDIFLPGRLNGLDVLKEIRKLSELSAVRIFVVTNLPDAIDRVMSLGANKCSMKTDVDLNMIEKGIEELLKGMR